ncbi:uncharacterized protein [Eucyclogobius newberryi]|uniref:uncharacterized protein n=1 Tax=Eucyclogobius newberryi TaxID=166745 RepID=UPI003B5A4F9B
MKKAVSCPGFHPDMNKKTKSHEACDKNWSGFTASTSHHNSDHHCPPLEPHLQPQVGNDDIDAEELFCPTLLSAALAPLALGADPGPSSDVLKQGYLGKQEQKHRRYFVLRAGSHSGPSRLEWYKTHESFTTVEMSSGKTGPFVSHKRGVMFLRRCLGISLIRSYRKDYKVSLHTKDQTLVFVGKDVQDQQEWYTAIKKQMEEELKDEDEEGFDEEDAGYCTLPLSSFYKQVWPVTVTARGLGRSKALAGEILLCLTASSLVLVRVGNDHEQPSVTMPLLAVRRFGHLNGSFFLELGRSAPHGPGEIWMEAREEGNVLLAQQIHMVVREAVRALRVIPDFNWSSSPSKRSTSLSHNLFAPMRSRPKQREKLGHCRPTGFPLPQVLSKSQNQSDHDIEETLRPDSVSLSPVTKEPSFDPEAESSMERKSDHSPLSEGPGYMLMSPQLSQSLHQDEYVSMTSPHKQALTKRTSLSVLQTSFSSFSDVQPQHITAQTPPPWTLFSGQQSNPRAVTAGTTSSPVRRAGGLTPICLFSRSPLEPVGPLPAPEQSVLRGILSCLPCLQPNRSHH